MSNLRPPMHPVSPPALPYFKPFVANRLRFNWQTGSLLIAVFSLVRFALALQANVTKSYQVIAFVFVAMALLPFLLLTRAGRQRIGVARPTRWAGVLLGGLLGFASCTALFFLPSSPLAWGKEIRWSIFLTPTPSCRGH